MPLVQAKCTNCGAGLKVDNTKDAAICPSCGTPYVVEKAINYFNTTNNISAKDKYRRRRRLDIISKWLPIAVLVVAIATILNTYDNRYPQPENKFLHIVAIAVCIISIVLSRSAAKADDDGWFVSSYILSVVLHLLYAVFFIFGGTDLAVNAVYITVEICIIIFSLLYPLIFREM